MIHSEINQILDKVAEFSENSKVWVYYSDQNFTHSREAIQRQIDDFSSQWTSHGDKVSAKGFIIADFIIVLITDETTNVSGCSTDSSVRFVKSIGEQFQLDFFNRNLVLTLENDQIQICQISDLKKVNKEKLVFNPYFKNLKDWRENFIKTLSESMFKRLI